jgi:hypothetical protein
MHAELNPYAPGAGLTPPELVGRAPEIDQFDLMVARSRRRLHSRGMILHGLRGVGKTVLLNRFRDHAERAEWLVVELAGQTSEGGADATRRKLARELALAARRLYRGRAMTESVRTALSAVSSFGMSFGGVSFDIGVEPTRGRADTRRIEVDLEELIEDLVPALLENTTAFVLFVDEMQDLDPGLLAALLAAQHRAGQRQWPFFLVGAGLPNLPATLGAARSYAERLFDYREIGALPSGAAAEALTIPAAKNGASFDPDALDRLVDASGGYPYYLQTYGAAAWELAIGTTITIADADGAVERGNVELDTGFFPARWDRATPAERQYLAAMAEDSAPTTSTAEVANRLGTRPQSLSPARQSLIDKGIIYAPDRGKVAFTVPNMGDFVRRRNGE